MRACRTITRLVALLLLLVGAAGPGWAARCLHVSSYHPGYEWSDALDAALDRTLAGKCELKHFYMDTRRHPGDAWAREKAKEARALIVKFRPDVLIASDDNASRYLVAPFLRNTKLPVVFCGVNWDVAEYGYPYSNATGMVEVAPLGAMLKHLRRILPKARRGLYLTANTRTEHKDYEHFRKVFADHGIHLDATFVSSLALWEQGYLDGQSYDFMVLGNYSGIADWNRGEAEHLALARAGTLTLTTYTWMMPYAALGITKRPEEQGEWAGRTALAILGGLKPSDIPVVPNRRWDLWVNPLMVKRLDVKVPDSIIIRANRYP